MLNASSPYLGITPCSCWHLQGIGNLVRLQGVQQDAKLLVGEGKKETLPNPDMVLFSCCSWHTAPPQRHQFQHLGGTTLRKLWRSADVGGEKTGRRKQRAVFHAILLA